MPALVAGDDHRSRLKRLTLIKDLELEVTLFPQTDISQINRRLLLRLIFTLALFSCLMTASIAYAVSVEGLYEVSVPVPDQGPDSRRQALDAGLEQVVDRMTGTPNWRDLYPASELQTNTQRLLEQYSYDRNPAADAANTTAGQGAVSPWLLKAKFSGGALSQMLAEKGLPVWSQNRPQTLFWIAQDQRGRRDVVAEGQGQPLVSSLQAAGKYWGLPMLLPLMDLEDSSALNVSDLWGFFAGPVEAASARYRSGAITLARLYRDNAGRWTGSWQVRINGQQLQQGEIEANSEAEWAHQLMANVASTLASKYAITLDENSANAVKLEVNNVRTFKDYVDVTRVLQKLAPVKSVEPFYVSRDVVRFELALSTYPEQLEEHMALQERLRPTVAGAPPPELGYWLYYHWESK